MNKSQIHNVKLAVQFVQASQSAKPAEDEDEIAPVPSVNEASENF